MRRVLPVSLLLLSTTLYAENVKIENGWGVEINPLRLIISTDNDNSWSSFSGTISHFNNETGVEISLPILYSKDISERDNYKDEKVALDIDLHYRQYFSKNRTTGAYIGAFGRYTYLDGKAMRNSKYATVKKFGVGGEIGFKIKNIFHTPFYWGASLALGSYIGSDNNIFETSYMSIDSFDLDDNRYIVDLELLKVGYEF